VWTSITELSGRREVGVEAEVARDDEA